jgi:hypothetical protein
MGRPSEEQLLGLRRPVPETNVSFEPPPPPKWALAETAPAEGIGAAPRRWRHGPRELIALAGVAAVVGLAVRSGDGLPFRSSEPPPPAAVGDVGRTTLAPDRMDVNRTASGLTAGTPATKKSDLQKDRAAQKGQKGATDPGGKDDAPPTGGGGGGDEKTKPLLQATVPGVGTVTVDQPELPTVPDVGTPTLPTRPDTGDVLPGTPTVSLP